MADSELVLAVMGRAWDDSQRWKRLPYPKDWVRRELLAAARADKPVVPVLVDREDVPTLLPFEPVPPWSDPLRLDSTDFWCAAEALVERVATHLGAPTAHRPARTPRDLVPLAVDAMLRHVLPGPQRRMGNGEMVARVVAAELGEREWLRFVATANLPHRPKGSAVVWVTSEHLGVADLDSNFRPRTEPSRVRLADIGVVGRADGRRLWKPVSDLRLVPGDGTVLDLRGFFGEEADELLEAIARPHHADG